MADQQEVWLANQLDRERAETEKLRHALKEQSLETARERVKTLCESLRMFTYNPDGTVSFWIDPDTVHLVGDMVEATVSVPMDKLDSWCLANAGVAVRTFMSVRDWMKYTGRKKAVITNEEAAEQAPKTMDDLMGRQKRPCKNCGPKPVDWQGGQ